MFKNKALTALLIPFALCAQTNNLSPSSSLGFTYTVTQTNYVDGQPVTVPVVGQTVFCDIYPGTDGNNGAHLHSEPIPPRPYGTIYPKSGRTDEDGNFSSNFFAPYIAGSTDIRCVSGPTYGGRTARYGIANLTHIPVSFAMRGPSPDFRHPDGIDYMDPASASRASQAFTAISQASGGQPVQVLMASLKYGGYNDTQLYGPTLPWQAAIGGGTPPNNSISYRVGPGGNPFGYEVDFYVQAWRDNPATLLSIRRAVENSGCTMGHNTGNGYVHMSCQDRPVNRRWWWPFDKYQQEKPQITQFHVNDTTYNASMSFVGVPVPSTPQYFVDVDPSMSFYDAANLMYEAGITTGCSQSADQSQLFFCPDNNVTRQEMAAFIVRAVTKQITPTVYNPTPYFTDVPPSSPFFAHIQKMKELGITTGCAANLFCPTDTIPRWQMAMFLIRARLTLNGASFNSAAAPYFADVPVNVEGNGQPFPFIQKAYEEHVTNGCSNNPLSFCPDQLVTRGQMASFIMRALYNETIDLSVPALYSDGLSYVDAAYWSSVTININGVNTNFQPGDSIYVPSGMLIPSNVVVKSPTSMSATFYVLNATPGPQSIVVTTGGHDLTLPMAISVGTY